MTQELESLKVDIQYLIINSQYKLLTIENENID